MDRPKRVTARTHLETVLLIMGPDWTWTPAVRDLHLAHGLDPRIRLYVEGNPTDGYSLILRVSLPPTLWYEDSHRIWPLRTTKGRPVSRIPKQAVLKAVAHYLQVLPR